MADDFGPSWYNKTENKETGRLSVINLVDDEYLQCSFYEHGQIVGCIPYYDKSFTYVKDASHNWCEGIMTVETVKGYTRQGDLFSV
tara:strand:- start:35 stop:292 length:258 start_codon:yes stop_codon:yes gene_type:complete